MTTLERIARAMHARFVTDMRHAFGESTEVRPWDSDKKSHALHLGQAQAALDELLQLPEEVCRPVGEWGIGEDGKRAAVTLSHNAFIRIIRLIKDGA